MILTDPDLIPAAFLQALVACKPYPAGLTEDHLYDHEVLPVAESDLPAVGVYLVSDERAGDDDGGGIHDRDATVQIEVRAVGHMLQSTAPFREWIERAVLTNETLAGMVLFVENIAQRPFGVAGIPRLAGRQIEFVARYQRLS